MHSAPTGPVYFDECRVPVENLLGEEGQGAVLFNDSMGWERACLFAFYLGSMERDLAQVVAYARERQQFGRPIGKNRPSLTASRT